MKAVRSLFELKTKLALQTFFRGGTDASVVKWAFALPWLIILMFASFSYGLTLFGGAYHAGGEQRILAAANLVFPVTFVVLLFASGAVAYRALFSSTDLTILLTAPVSLRAIFLHKVVEVLRSSGKLYLFMFLPGFVALGVVLGSGFLYYVALLALSVPFVITSTIITTTLTMLVVRYTRPRMTTEVLILVLIVIAFLAFLGLQFVLSENAGITLAQNLDGVRVPSVMQPGVLMAWATVHAGFADFGRASLPALLLFATSLSLLFVAVPINERLYLESYTRSQTVILRKRGTGIARLLVLPRFLPLSVRAIFEKDLRTISRDVGEHVRLMFATCLAGLLLLSGPRVLKIAVLRGSLTLSDVGAGAAVFLTTLMLGYAFCLSLYGFARERKGFWILDLAPVDRKKIVIAKTLIGFLSSLLIIETVWIVTGIVLEYPRVTLVLGVIAVAGALPGVNAIGVMLGAQFARWGVAVSGKFDQGGAEPFFGLMGLTYLVIVLGIPLMPHLDPGVTTSPTLLWIGSGLWFFIWSLAAPIGLVFMAASYLEEIEIYPRISDDVVVRQAEKMARTLFGDLSQ